MRVSILRFGLALALLSITAFTNAAPLRIATEGAYAPWNATAPDGTLVGFEIDLAQDLCARMKVECEIVAQDWDGIIPALLQGKFDAIMAAMAANDERRKVIAFSSPYAAPPVGLAVLTDSDLSRAQLPSPRINLSDPRSLSENLPAIDLLVTTLGLRKVGVQTATIHEELANRHLVGATAKPYDKFDNALLDLAAGRVAAVIADRAMLVARPDAAKYALIGPAFIGGVLGEGVAVGLRRADISLKARFDRSIADAAKDGTIRRLSERWFKADISVHR